MLVIKSAGVELMGNNKIELVDVVFAIGFIILIIAIVLNNLYLKGILEIVIGITFITKGVIDNKYPNKLKKKELVIVLSNPVLGIIFLLTGLKDLCLV